LDALGEHDFLHGRLRDRYVALHGGSSVDLWRITTHAPKRSGRGRRDRRPLKFYELRNNLMRILFVPTFTTTHGLGEADISSDAIGYGITCAAALTDGLQSIGHEIEAVDVPTDSGRTEWIGRVLAELERRLRRERYDAILMFHAFWPFAAEIRRLLDDLGVSVALVGYAHGSHWDRTDLFRQARYPRLRWLDLGNLLALDRVLADSHYMRDVLVSGVMTVSERAAAELDARLRPVGLPLDLSHIDAVQCAPADGYVGVVFNHALIPAKQPGLFFDVARDVLASENVYVVVTRNLAKDCEWRGAAECLERRFPGRVTLGRDFSIDAYYRCLWRCSLQVSTATHESFGIATLEAMVTQNHCLVPRRASYPEICDGDKDALYDTADELTARLHDAIAHPQASAETARRLSDAARRRYNPVRVAGAVGAVLAEAVADRALG
jgi:hypothetical protein